MPRIPLVNPHREYLSSGLYRRSTSVSMQIARNRSTSSDRNQDGCQFYHQFEIQMCGYRATQHSSGVQRLHPFLYLLFVAFSTPLENPTTEDQNGNKLPAPDIRSLEKSLPMVLSGRYPGKWLSSQSSSLGSKISVEGAALPAHPILNQSHATLLRPVSPTLVVVPHSNTVLNTKILEGCQIRSISISQEIFSQLHERPCHTLSIHIAPASSGCFLGSMPVATKRFLNTGSVSPISAPMPQ